MLYRQLDHTLAQNPKRNYIGRPKYALSDSVYMCGHVPIKLYLLPLKVNEDVHMHSCYNSILHVNVHMYEHSRL